MRAFFIALLLIFGTTTYAQILNESSTISLLTASPGDELYSTFGHSAIRIKDPSLGLDIVYNYGTFNPYVDYFYLKFTRRKIDYYLSKAEMDDFAYGYRIENRSIVEQVLNLTTDQKNSLYRALRNNYRPENRAYRYDFFFDNCATRIRDIFPSALGKDFSYHYPGEWQKGSMTFRNLIDLYLVNHHWSDFGIDLALGLPTDDIATPSDYMFLPDYLFKGIEKATINHNGKELPFVSSTSVIIPRKEMPPSAFFISPLLVCWSIFAITLLLSIYGYKNKRKFIWYDVVLFTLIGLVGWVVFLLDHATDHIATKENLNVLWAVPLHLPLFLFWWKLPWRIFRIYIGVCLILDLFILALWMVFPQNYHNAFIPLILSMIIRYMMMIKFEKVRIE